MAFVVPTPPPDLVVKTRVKKGRTRIEESTGLCDRFWACVLDDYLDDDDSGLIEALPQQQLDILRKKHREKKKKELKRQRGENTKEMLAVSEEEEMAREIENILSGNHEMDQREKEVIDSAHSDDIVLDIINQVDIINHVKTRETGPEEETNREHKQKKRAQTSPTALEPRSFKAAESSPEQQEAVDNVPDQRAKSSGAVYHYAPLSRDQQATTSRVSRGHLNRPSRTSRDPLSGDRRVPKDADETQLFPNRVSRFRGGDHIDFPRNPSTIDPPHQHARPSVSRRERLSTERKSNSRFETIDLTDQSFHKSSFQGRSDERRKVVKVEIMDRNTADEDPVGWAIRESKRGDAEFRRRKLDRKEALDRIRIIKARLNTVNP